MNKIEVTSCEDCPFQNSEYNDFAEKDTIFTCSLISYLNPSFHHIIYAYSSIGKENMPDSKTPTWCPLDKKEEITIKKIVNEIGSNI